MTANSGMFFSKSSKKDLLLPDGVTMIDETPMSNDDMGKRTNIRIDRQEEETKIFVNHPNRIR